MKRVVASPRKRGVATTGSLGVAGRVGLVAGGAGVEVANLPVATVDADFSPTSVADNVACSVDGVALVSVWALARDASGFFTSQPPSGLGRCGVGCPCSCESCFLGGYGIDAPLLVDLRRVGQNGGHAGSPGVPALMRAFQYRVITVEDYDRARDRAGDDGVEDLLRERGMLA